MNRRLRTNPPWREIKACPKVCPSDRIGEEKQRVVADLEKQPLLSIFGEGQPVQYQRADIVLDEDEQRELEIKKYKYVVAQPRMLQCFL